MAWCALELSLSGSRHIVLGAKCGEYPFVDTGLNSVATRLPGHFLRLIRGSRTVCVAHEPARVVGEAVGVPAARDRHAGGKGGIGGAALAADLRKHGERVSSRLVLYHNSFANSAGVML